MSLEFRGRWILSTDASFQFSAHMWQKSHAIEVADWDINKWVRVDGEVVWRPRPGICGDKQGGKTV